jgi:small redox-active disulfide protein 2
MNIKVLGPGCANCKTLYRRTEEALEGLHMEASIEKVEAYEEIAKFGILRTPGLVFDGKVVMSGAVPPVEKIKELLTSHVAAR